MLWMFRPWRPDTILIGTLASRTSEGMDFAMNLHRLFITSVRKESPLLTMKPVDSQSKSNSSETSMTFETIISVGVLGWLAVGMVLMGLGIW